MKTAGIITEFNPFHLGHKYIAEKAREETGADLIIALMSGNFVQRGEPALFDMGIRAEAALKNGYDMVFEMPPHISTRSAEGFALGAVHLLNCLGTDILVFGSECGNPGLLSSVSDMISDENDEYKAVLRECLKKGESFPAAREHAIISCLSCNSPEEKANLHEILQNPNDILGLEYLKALKKTGSSMTPITIPRINSPYHEDASGNTGYSAESIRNAVFSDTLSANEDNSFFNYLNDNGLNYISEAYFSSGAQNPDSLTPFLLYKLSADDLEEDLKKACVPEDLSKRILNNRTFTGVFSEFCRDLKVKNITYTAISRHLLHLILDMDLNSPFNDVTVYDHLRLLGFNKTKAGCFNEIKKRSSLAILSNSSDIKAYLDESSDDLRRVNSALLNASLRIDQSYNLLRSDEKRRKHPLPPEISRKIIKL